MGGNGTGQLVGREAESSQLLDALTRANSGQPQVVLVAGDAGIGKTSLIADLEARAGELGFATTRGQCLDIHAEIPLAPAVAAIRVLLSTGDAGEGRPQAQWVRKLLDPSSPQVEHVRLLDHLRLAFLEAAAAGPVLIVFEDLHWVDASTQDLVAALAGTASGRMLLALTFRSDELHRGHPLRTALAEMGRIDRAKIIDLRPLGRRDVATLMAGHTGTTPQPSVLTSMLERSEGNPLYVEELLAAEEISGTSGIPEHLADLLRARVDRLSDQTRRLLRVASVDGSGVDTELLTQVTGRGREDIEGSLREALDANVLRKRADQLEFRHGLIREAVYDDLLPDERTRMHAAVATVLEARIDSAGTASMLDLTRAAFHWREAQDVPEAFVASIRAGRAATRLGTAEGVHHLEYALSVWDQIPDAEPRSGIARAELLLTLSLALHGQGDLTGFRDRVYEAVRLIGPDTDQLLASRIYGAVARCRPFPDDPIDQAATVELSLKLAGEEPSEELAYALVAKAQFLNTQDRLAESLEWAGRAMDASRTVGCTEPLVWSMGCSALDHFKLGSLDEAFGLLAEAYRMAREAGLLREATYRGLVLAILLAQSGRVQESVTWAERLVSEGRALGLSERVAECVAVVQQVRAWQGRFDESEALLDDAVAMGMATTRAQLQKADLLLARGDGDGAKLVLSDMGSDADLSEIQADVGVEMHTELLCTLGAWEEAGQIAVSYLDELEASESPLEHAAAAYSGYRTACLAGSPGVAVPDSLESLAHRSLVCARDGLSDGWRSSYCAAVLLLAGAYESRLAGRPYIDGLRTAVILSEPYAFLALEPRLLLAEDLLAHGQRDEGRELLVKVWGDAHAMGAGEYERRARRAATRTRVTLPAEAVDLGPLNRLTAREREVLHLLAEGATNRHIAHTLFITEKTASVHVSRLLAKLDVPNRGAAAALARRYESRIS
jgi:DNA-binding CsgD family transcriptional regulator/tetratricopeptide (TPR) repeat protein